MKERGKKLMVIMLSLMMIASSFITFSFAEDAQNETPKAETESVKESKPEPVKAKAPEPEPVKEKPPAPEPVKEKAPDPEPVKESTPDPAPEPVADSSSNTGGDETPNDVAEDSAPSVEQTPLEEVSKDIPQANSNNEQVVSEEGKEEVKEEEKEDEEEMPAQSFSGSAGGLCVSASAGKGVFPKGTKMKVTSASSSGIVDASQSLTGEDSEVVDAAAADITFYKNGGEIQPKGSVKISLRPTRALDGDTFKMVHVSGGSVDVVAGASAGGASASVSSFSIYGIIGEEYDEDTDTKARYTYNFFVGEELVDSQTVIDGEYLSAPADPKVAAGKFKGWQIAGQSGMLDFSDPISISDDVTEDKEFTVKAVIDETFYATFWKDEEKTEVLETKEGKSGAEITTSDVTWKFPDGKGIVGWKLNGAAVTKFNITSNVDLLPIISNDVVQVSFATGEGTPIAPVFVEVGKTLTKPDDPTRTGYTFKGWFTDEACSNVYNFSDKVENAFTLYAKWEGQKTTYKVVRWKQNANDDGYTFAEMETKSANAGLNAEYSAKNYQGFTLNSAKSNETVIIKGDGTTIKNVYYDRITYPLTFYVYEKTGTTGWGIFQTDVYEWVLKGTKDFRYEADTSAYWNEISAQYPSCKWYTGKNSNTAYQVAPVMEPAGGGSLSGFKGITVYGIESSGESIIYYLDYNNKTTQIRTPYNNPSSGWSHTEEDFIQIPGWTFKEVGKGYPKREKGIYTSKLYYTRNNYGVKFIPGNGDASIEKTAAYEAPINNLVPSNYNSESTWNNNGIAKTFAGWYNNEALVGEPVDFSSMKMPALHAGGSLVFYGKWTAAQHNVSFDLNGGTFDGSDSIAAQIVESGKEATAPDSSLMEKEGGYVFGGWIDENGNRFSFDTKVIEDYNLKAVWNSDKTKLLGIEYVVGDGTGSVSDSIMYQDGAYAIIKGQPKAPEGKYFEGWKIGSSDLVLASGSFQVKSEYAVDDTVTLTAQYADKPKYPTSVTYNLNGGNINGNTESIVDENAVINGKYTVGNYEPKKDDCTFIGWSTNVNGTGGIFRSGMKVAAGKDNNILYAQWKDNPKIGVKLTIIGNSDDKIFNGKEQSVEGFVYKLAAASSDGETIPEKAVSVELKADKKAEASGTNADTYKMGLSMNHFEIEVAKGYALVGDPVIEDGVLKISPYPITVQITGNTRTVLENDQEQSVSGFEATAVGDGHPSSFDINNVRWQNGATPVAKGTEPDTYPMGLDKKDFSYLGKNFDVTFKVSDGWLKITPKTKVKVIITGKSDGKKVYDGTEQSIEGFDYELEEVPADTPVVPILRLFKGSAKAPIPEEAVSVELKADKEAKASGTNAGEYEMGLTKDHFEITPTEGYKVVGDPDITDGVMKINPYELTVLIKGETKSVPQDGQEHSVEGFKAEPEKSGYPSTFNVDNVLWKGGETPKAKGVDPGKYTVKLNADEFSYDDTNFALKYDIKNNVELDITPVTVDVTVKKEWNDEGNKDEIRPSEVQVILMVNGDGAPDYLPITLSEDNEWTHTWEKMPKYIGEQVLEYSVAEMNVPEGYSAEVNGSEDGGFIITNTHIPEKEEEIKPPEIPNQKEDVLPAFEDETGDDDGGNGSGDDAVVKGKSSGTGGVETADNSNIMLFVKILSFAAVVLLILLISRIKHEEDSE